MNGIPFVFTVKYENSLRCEDSEEQFSLPWRRLRSPFCARNELVLAPPAAVSCPAAFIQTAPLCTRRTEEVGGGGKLWRLQTGDAAAHGAAGGRVGHRLGLVSGEVSPVSRLVGTFRA